MKYKLRKLRSSRHFATVIINNPFLKEGDLFKFDGDYYKIIQFIGVAIECEAKGYPVVDDGNLELLPELTVEEVPVI